MKNYPEHPLYHILLPNSQKEFSAAQKTMRVGPAAPKMPQR